MTDMLPLASAFPPATRDQWLTLVEGVLKGAGFDKRLVSTTYDALRIEPLYPKAEGISPTVTGHSGRWRIAQRVDHPDPAAANALALADLEGGADSLTLVLSDAPSARGFGLAPDAIARALEGVQLELIHLRLEAGLDAAIRLAADAATQSKGLSALDLDLGQDPIGTLARSGGEPASVSAVVAKFPAALSTLAGQGFRGRLLLADARPFHEAGASEAQELAAALAAGVAYLRGLEAAGTALDTARDTLAFLLVADPDQFLTMAKFRAFRRLWARVEEACGLEPRPIRLHAETAWRATTRRDPWVNILRGTMGAFAAGIAGADSVTVLPFTAALGLPDAFARRLARNTQVLLLEEVNLWRVADPAAGSGGIEALTEGLCEKAWELFQAIESEGGLVASLAAGAFQARIATVAAERTRNIARRKDPLTGTSEFPHLRETPVSVLLPAPCSATHAPSPAGSVAPLPSLRSAEPFEVLRDAADEVLRSTGARPKVFLANLGPVAAFTARSSFAVNALEAGGLEAIGNDGFASAERAAEAFVSSGARVACLCSSDETYAAQAVEVARALKRAGAVRVGLAGRPGELERDLAEAGTDFYLFAGCDLIRALTDVLAAASNPLSEGAPASHR